jgi:adenylate cyclase
VRRVALRVQAPDGSVVPSFVAEVSRIAGIADHFALAPHDDDGRVMVNFDDHPFAAFRTISAADVLRGTADLSAIKGGVVFVGSTASDLHDALLVPTSSGVPMPGVEIHASFFDTLLHERWLQPVPFIVIELFLVVLGLLIGFVVSRLRARWSVLVILGLWIASLIVSFVLFDRGWIMDVVWSTLVFVFADAIVTLERRVTSDRQKRQLKSVLMRYVSPSVVESILKDPSKFKLGGERRRMSVIFSDIRGFTTISEGLSPEQLVHYLNIYLSRMTEIVFANGGVLDKYIGDAVMAFWNAPFDQADHAVRAVKTALNWQDALAEMNTAKAFGNLEFHIGAGVNTGDMIVGNVGGDARFDYTVIGDNVNLGSRLEGLTKEYGVRVLITEATQKDVAKAFVTRKLDKVAVKGKKEPVVIYEAMVEMEKATEAHKQLAKDFEAALEAYFSRNFADAIVKCEAIQKMMPNDGPTKLLIERAHIFTETPPPADWVGTWVYTKK